MKLVLVLVLMPAFLVAQKFDGFGQFKINKTTIDDMVSIARQAGLDEVAASSDLDVSRQERYENIIIELLADSSNILRRPKIRTHAH